MHRTEGKRHLNNMFSGSPFPGTRVEENWLNAVQEEICNVIEKSGIAVKTAATETTRDQLYQAIASRLIPASGAEDNIVLFDCNGRPFKDSGKTLTEVTNLLKFITPVNLITWTTATDWTDMNISALTETDTTKAALLAMELLIGDSEGTASAFQMTGLCRKKGSSETTVLPRIVARTYHGNYDTSCHTGNANMLVVECDTSGVFEVKLQLNEGSPSAISFKVDLIGYFVR